jgi:endonuclease/exonuclease/phosphatase family metal-dependent hydrolase
VSFDPYAPYGPVVSSTVRVVTWNVWGRYGADWAARQAALEGTLAQTAPDLICLVEAWRQGDQTQPGLVAARLGLPYHQFTGDWRQEDWVSGVGLVSRWPMTEPVSRPLRSADGAGSGHAVYVEVAGDRGPIYLFAAMLDHPLDASGLRQDQVRQLAQFITQTASRREPIVVCGDFNAGPDSDEIRMLTGRSAPAAPGLVFYDAWEVRGTAPPATPGPIAIRWPPSACTGPALRLHPLGVAAARRRRAPGALLAARRPRTR